MQVGIKYQVLPRNGMELHGHRVRGEVIVKQEVPVSVNLNVTRIMIEKMVIVQRKKGQIRRVHDYQL
jgi:hypothetical protein